MAAACHPVARPPLPLLRAQAPASSALLQRLIHDLWDMRRTPEEYALGSVPGSINIPVKLDDGTGAFVPNPEFVEQVRVSPSAPLR